MARQHVFYIDKERFLPAFKDAFFEVYTYENCKKAFQATGLVPINAQVVLDRLNVRLRTPPGPLSLETPWQSQTPSNTYEFSSQLKLVGDSFVRSPVAAKQGFSQLIKGAELMLHQNVLMSQRISELEAQLETVTKRKTRKRKRLQTGGVLEYGEGVSYVAAEASSSNQRTKKGGGGGGGEPAQPSQRRCGNCGETGHNARTCQKDTEAPSDSDTPSSYEGLIVDSE